jgi:hypothetical protein
LNTTNPPTHHHHNPPTPLQSPTTNIQNNPAYTDFIAAEFDKAFPYYTTPPQIDHPNNHTPIFNYSPPQPPPIQTILNPYNRHTNIINYSREYTPQELETIQTAKNASLQAQETSRILSPVP